MKVWRKDIGKTDLIQNLLEKNTEDGRIQIECIFFFWGGDEIEEVFGTDLCRDSPYQTQ